MIDVHNKAMIDSVGSIYFTDTTDVDQIFSRELTYNKGSAVIHTFRFLLRDSLFFKAIKNYLSTFGFSNADIHDFKVPIEGFSGILLDNYFNQWIYGEGYPIYSAEYYANGTNLFLKMHHATSAISIILFKTPMEIRCTSSSGDTTIKVEITHNIDTFIIPMSKTSTSIEINPNNWLLHKVDTVYENANLQELNVKDLDSENTIILFPNPANYEIILFNVLPPYTKVEVMDRIGNIIELYSYSKAIRIPVGLLPNSIYIVRLINKNGITNKKFSKH